MTVATTTFTRSHLSPAPLSTGPVIVAVGGDDVAGVLRAANHFPLSPGGTMVAVAVLEPLAGYLSGDTPGMLPPDYEMERAAVRLATLDKQLHDIVGTDSGWSTEIAYGEPADAISELARVRKSPYILMGIGRHKPLDRLLGTETTLHTIRRASCPVIAIHSHTDAPLREVVVATDFSPSSAKAAESVIPLLSSGSVLHLVHVWKPTGTEDTRLRPLDEAYLRSLPEKFRRLRASIAVPPGVVIKEEVREGRVAERLLDYANAHHADLIVAGRHGLNALARILAGSVTTALLRGASCSVLIAPQPTFGELDRFGRLLSGTSESRKPEGWSIQLDEFTRRNRGRRAIVEVDDLAFGAQVLETGYLFNGAAYDRHDHRIELMLGAADGSTGHVTRGIVNIETVTIATDPFGTDVGLRIGHGPGQTLLTFLSV